MGNRPSGLDRGDAAKVDPRRAGDVLRSSGILRQATEVPTFQHLSRQAPSGRDEAHIVGLRDPPMLKDGDFSKDVREDAVRSPKVIDQGEDLRRPNEVQVGSLLA